MNERWIGTLIRKKRLELGWSQEGLCRGICALVELTGKELGSKDRRIAKISLGVYVVKLRLGEYRSYGVIEELLRYVLRIVSVYDSYPLYTADAEEG